MSTLELDKRKQTRIQDYEPRDTRDRLTFSTVEFKQACVVLKEFNCALTFGMFHEVEQEQIWYSAKYNHHTHIYHYTNMSLWMSFLIYDCMTIDVKGLMRLLLVFFVYQQFDTNS